MHCNIDTYHTSTELKRASHVATGENPSLPFLHISSRYDSAAGNDNVITNYRYLLYIITYFIIFYVPTLYKFHLEYCYYILFGVKIV